MSAQYRPYRNEVGLENDNVNWDEGELGDVQIYQKTTEDIRYVSNRNLIIGGIGIALFGALIGMLIGYFAHTEHSECVPSLAVALHSVQRENPEIRQKILEMVNAERIRESMKTISAQPHIAGSLADEKLANMVKDQLLSSGLDKVHVSNYNVLLSYPDKDKVNKFTIVDNTGNEIYAEYGNLDGNLKPFSAYSPAGNITGDLVFVNYCSTSDLHEVQEKYNIDLEGKILLAKQLHSSIDEQVWNAHAVKAAGLIVFPDPKEYNPPMLKTKPYPDSWWLPENATRRDSVFWNGIGDPLTPGYPSVDGVGRISLDSAVLPHIPVHQISYYSAYHLLSSLGGNEAPSTWQGGLNVSYHLGPGFKLKNQKIKLEINNVYANKTIYNVFGYIKGKTETDRYVLIGSRRDSWTYGAVESAGGTAALLELSRIFGELLKQGWRPRRTIIFCSWGAEEYNLIGSTEWVEDNFGILQSRAVAYINADSLVIGNTSVTVAASPLLYHAIFNATKQVQNPNEEEEMLRGLKTVYDAWVLTFPMERNSSTLPFGENIDGNFLFEDYDDLHTKGFESAEEGKSLFENYVKSAMQNPRPRMKDWDMKSSYAPFFYYAGIPFVDVTYVHDTLFTYPAYHTEYDTFHYVETFIDPTFKYHAAVVQVLGELLRDLSDSLFLPFNILDYAQMLAEYYHQLHEPTQDLLQGRGVDLDYFNFALKNFTAAAMRFHYLQEKVDLSDPMTIRRINDQLLLLERTFVYQNRLPHIVKSSSGGRFLYSQEDISFIFNYDEDIARKLTKEHYSRLILMLQSSTESLNDIV